MRPKSHTLFHFTKSKDALLSIMKEGFWPRFCQEDISWTGIVDCGFMAYPMVSFCDIPISRLDEHIDFYGRFGIGLSREWAVKNELNPVLYISGQNIVARMIGEITTWGMTLPVDSKVAFAQSCSGLFSFIKPTEGTMKIAENSKWKEFYQESEWRYVPVDTNIRCALGASDFENTEFRRIENEKIKKHCKLCFDSNDVKYIFVPTDFEIPEVVDFIEMQLTNHSDLERKILMSRVISLQSIMSDF